MINKLTNMMTIQKTLNQAKGRRYEDDVTEKLRPEYDYIWPWRDVPEKILIDNKIIIDYSKYSESRKDIGIYVVAMKDGKLTFIQCKNYEHNVRVDDIAGFLFFMIINDIPGVICYSNDISSFIKNQINEKIDITRLKITLRHIPFDNEIINHPITEEIFEARDYQLEAIKLLSNKKYKKVGLFMPCGCGKTYVSSMIGKKYDNVIVLSPLRQLTSNTLNSMSRFLGKEYYKILISSDGMRDIEAITEVISSKNAIGCTYDSVDVLVKIIDNLENSCIIVDECHNLNKNHLTNEDDNMYKILNKDIKIVYVSATPKSGYKYDAVYRYKWEKAIEEEHICDFDITIPQKEVIDNLNLNKMLELLKDVTDINEKMIKKAYFLIRSLLFNGNKKCIVYLTTIAKAKLFENVISGLLKLLNVECEIHTITNKTSKGNRENSIYRIKHNTMLTIILNVHIFDEGIDIPECDSVYITQPGKNIDNLIQRMCRCNRITDTKKECNMYIWTTEKKTKTILDYIKDNTYDKIFEKINSYNPIKNELKNKIRDKKSTIIKDSIDVNNEDKNNPRELKKLGTTLSHEFIDEYAKFYDEGKKTKFGIDLEDVIKFLNISCTKMFYATFRKKYIKDIDYISERISGKSMKGIQQVKYYITLDTFEKICLFTRSNKRDQMRIYFIESYKIKE
jgi:superfamily II DNA or RNA helicase/phage anti-repressor protein